MKKLLAIALAIAFAIPLLAQLPKTLSFQGYLTSNTGEPITNNSLSVSFSLFTVASGGTAVWGPEPQTIDVDKGIFSTTLGATEPLNVSTDLKFDRPYFLQITIAGEDLPRIAVTPGIYSLSSLNAANITTNTVAIANGGTNADNASGARTNLGLAIGTDVQAFDADLTDLADGELSGSKVGTGINATNITTNTLAISNGGTGASTTSTARSNLGLTIGTDVQAFDTALNSISGLTTTADRMIYTTDSDIYSVTVLSSFGRSIIDDADEAAFKATTNLEIGTDVQAYDAGLQSIASLSTVADRILYTDGSDSYTSTAITAYARSLLDDPDAATARGTIGLTIGGNVQAYDAGLTSIAGLTTSANQMIYTDASDSYTTASLTSYARSILDDTDEATFKSTVNLEIGTDIQAFDAGLNSIAGLTTSADQLIYTTAGDTYTTSSLTSLGRSLLDDASAADARTTLGAQASDADLDDLADGSLSGTSVNPDFGTQNIITTGGLHIGGSSTPDADDAIIDGTLAVGGITTPNTTLDVRHGTGTPSTGDGLTVSRTTSEKWTFYVFSGGALGLYYNNAYRGEFNSSTGAYVETSDRRLKKNISAYQNVLKNVTQLPIVEYHFKNQSNDQPKKVGVIAQETKPLFPHLVNYSMANDLYTVDYSGLGVIAIKAIQEQQEIIDSLSNRISQLENQITVQTQIQNKQEASIQDHTEKINQLITLVNQLKKEETVSLQVSKDH